MDAVNGIWRCFWDSSVLFWDGETFRWDPSRNFREFSAFRGWWKFHGRKSPEFSRNSGHFWGFFEILPAILGLFQDFEMPPSPPFLPLHPKNLHFFCEFLVILKSWFLNLFSGFSVTLVWPPNRSDWSKWNQFESVEMDEKIEPVQLKGIRQNRCNRPCRWWSGTSCSFQLHHTCKRKLSANCWRSPRHGRNLKKQTIN